jgi:hypothetical protein
MWRRLKETGKKFTLKYRGGGLNSRYQSGLIIISQPNVKIYSREIIDMLRINLNWYLFFVNTSVKTAKSRLVYVGFGLSLNIDRFKFGLRFRLIDIGKLELEVENESTFLKYRIFENQCWSRRISTFLIETSNPKNILFVTYRTM